MSITAKQAREAVYYLEKCAKEALLMDYMRETDGFHASELERYFAKAATALGFNLVRVEGNVLHIVPKAGAL